MKRKASPTSSGPPSSQDLKQIVAAIKKSKEDKPHKYPSKKKRKVDDNADIVASHYNSRLDVGIQARKDSPIIHLKNFNNWIKSVLIQRYVKEGGTILDLCCGKGGDLQKFHQKRIKAYYGADIAEGSIKDAVARYNQTQNQHPSKQFRFSATFIAGDCCQKKLTSVLPPNVQFDSVSCQFSLHYSFQSEQKARTLLTNATERLKAGGHFIVTVPDAYVLVKKLRASDPLIVQNKVAKAVFTSKTFKHPFGNKYTFELIDAIDNCPEYLVPPRSFVNLAREYNLTIVEQRNFHEFFDVWSDSEEFRILTDGVYKLREGDMTTDEWDAIYYYRVFVFRKEGEVKRQSMEGYNPSQNTSFFKAVHPTEIKYL